MIGAWEDRADMTIWMDGRPHPSKNAPHVQTGFTTGTWHGDDAHRLHHAHEERLSAPQRRAHQRPGYDDHHFLRHGDLLTLVLVEEDPVYLTEPYVITRTYVLTPRPISPGGPPCIIGYEGVPEGKVPHYLPDKNPFVNEMDKIYHIPPEAALGGADTMYPDFRDKIKDKFTIPPRCARDCGTPPPPAPPPPAGGK